jgi:hypothetical protein
MDKLVSLKEKPATKEDVGITFYGLEDNVLTEVIPEYISGDYFIDNKKRVCKINSPFIFRQIPVIIAESEYKQLTAKLEEVTKERDESETYLRALQDKINSLGIKDCHSDIEAIDKLVSKLEEAKGLLEKQNKQLLSSLGALKVFDERPWVKEIMESMLLVLKDYSKVEK